MISYRSLLLSTIVLNDIYILYIYIYIYIYVYISLGTLVPNSRDRHEKTMATGFYAPQNSP